jgi:hypothetical protein
MDTFIQITNNINNDVEKVFCGGCHTVIIKTDGSVWACGRNNTGHLGLGDTNQKNVFTKITTNINNDVKYIACGYGHVAVLKNDGSVWTCGQNDYGQLGIGTTGSSAYKTTLTQVTTNINNDVKYIACGSYNTFVIKNDGNVLGCGINTYGQLGIGDTDHRNTLTSVNQSEALQSAVQSLNAEATTNRGNLATVLTDEGVELTGDETLADLIVKTDEEFNRLKYRRGAVVECNVSVDGSKGKNNGTRYSDTISTTVTTNFGFIPSIIILYFDTGGRNVVSGDVYPLSGTLEILIDTNVDSNLLYATSVTENSFTLVSRNARDRNDGTGDLYYYQGNVIKIYGIE